MRLRTVILASTALAALAACGGSDSPAGPSATPAAVQVVTAATQSATAGQLVATTPSFVVKDASGNAVAGVPVSILVTSGGGKLASAATISGSGPTAVGQWTLGSAAGTNTLSITVANLTPVTVSATGAAGPMQSLTVTSGGSQSALAGTAVPTPIIVTALDQFGNTVAGQSATFSTVGGGTIAATTATGGSNGAITAPAWTLGKSALPQQLVVTAGGHSVTIDATVQTGFSIDVRFWGPAMTADQQALFTNAAARIKAIIVGQTPTVGTGTAGADPANCGVTGQSVIHGNISSVIIYASVQAIDGVGKTLAQSGPCYTYSYAGGMGTAIGVMEFDSADLQSMTGGGSLQDVITHEMLHVVGIGTFWDSTAQNLLSNFGLSNVAYTGKGGIAGCVAVGGSSTCATSVPVENTGGDGTKNSHWRESVFGSELMTGYANAGGMPLSIMTIRALEDLGYQVDTAAADPYRIPSTGSLRASLQLGTPAEPWERALPNAPKQLPVMGLPPRLR